MQEQLSRKRKSDVSQHDNFAALMGTPCVFYRGVVAYMDVGKGREQDAEALLWRHSFAYFSFAAERKVGRLRGETRNG